LNAEISLRGHRQGSLRIRCPLRQFPRVWRPHDDLEFSDPTQALAYLILHLPDRYTRMFQVLECLLSSGRLPLGKGDNFAAIDIGAGPGPGIFAIRSFYAALAHYVSLHDPSRPVATLGSTDVVERSQGMPCAMPSRRPRMDVIRSSCLPGSAGRPRPSSRRPLHERGTSAATGALPMPDHLPNSRCPQLCWRCRFTGRP